MNLKPRQEFTPRVSCLDCITDDDNKFEPKKKAVCKTHNEAKNGNCDVAILAFDHRKDCPFNSENEGQLNVDHNNRD